MRQEAFEYEAGSGRFQGTDNGRRSAACAALAPWQRGLAGRFAAMMLAALTAAFFVLVYAQTSFAAGGLSMNTKYPGMSVKAGDSQNVSLNFSNESGAGMDVTLGVQSIPEGWEGYFTGGSTQVSRVHVASGDNDGLASFHYTVPADAAEGSYEIVLTASGAAGSATLPLQLEVTETNVGASEFTVEYPEQEGASGTSFTFSGTITNSSTEDQSYSFSTSAPDGWQVAIKPSSSSTQVASIDVGAGESQGLSISVTPPNNVEAGDFPISISASSANENLKADLSVKITGSYKLDLTTPSGLLSLSAHANKETAFTLKLTNNGNIDLQNINLTSSAPDGWTVRFDNSAVETLTAGSTQEITAYVTPSEDALSGDYALSIQADCDETSSSVDFRVAVKTEVVWGIVGVLIIALVIAGLGFLFKRYGRR